MTTMRVFLISLIALTLCFVGQAYGQYVTSSLNPMAETVYPAATAWRFANAVAISQDSTTGKLDGTSEDKELKTSNNDLFLSWRTKKFAIEGQGSSSTQTIEGTASSVTYEQTLTSSGNQILMSYILGESFAIGIGQSNVMSDSKYEATGVLSKVKTSYFNHSVSTSFKLSEEFIIGVGANIVTHNEHTELTVDASSDLNVNSDAMENRWAEIGYGLSILSGEPGKFQFRVEVFSIRSPASKRSAENGKYANYHQKSTTVNTAIELKTTNYLLSYATSNQFEEELTTDAGGTEEEVTTQTTTFGFGYVPTDSWNVMAYMATEKESKAQTTGDDETKSTTYSIIVGYNF